MRIATFRPLCSWSSSYSFVKKITKNNSKTARKEHVYGIISTVVLPYIRGVTKALGRFLQQQAWRLFLSLIWHLDHIQCDLTTIRKTRRSCLQDFLKMWKIYTGETGGTVHERIKEHGLLVLRPQEFQRMLMRPGNIRSGTRLSLLTPTSIGIMELKFLKRGCPRSNSTTADQYYSGRLREQRVVWTMTIEILQSLTPQASIEMHQSPSTMVLLILIHSQSTPSPADWAINILSILLNPLVGCPVEDHGQFFWSFLSTSTTAVFTLLTDFAIQRALEIPPSVALLNYFEKGPWNRTCKAMYN